MTTHERAADGLVDVMASGDYRASLEALRDRLAAGIDGSTDRQLIHLAPLAKQLADVLKLLADLPVADAPADTVETAQDGVQRKLRAVQ